MRKQYRHKYLTGNFFILNEIYRCMAFRQTDRPSSVHKTVSSCMDPLLSIYHIGFNLN